MKKIFYTSFLLFCLTRICFAAVPTLYSTNWYDNFIFKEKSFTFEFIRTLGYAYAGAADLGESINTATKIQNGNIDSWTTQWLATADRINQLGLNMQAVGNEISAQELFFRAANYYRTAAFYMDAEKDRPKSVLINKAGKSAFLKAISTISYIKTVSIPYENTFLPGYFIRSSLKNAPLLIVHTGFDGTAEEIYFEVGIAAHKRGYNVLLFEGPGQGSVLREQHLTFRYDWEHVVTPVVDFALTLPNINKNKIALMGISLGGFLAARACAFEPRLSACILNGGVYSVAGNIYKQLPKEVTALIRSNPAKFNTIIESIMKKDINTQWFYNNAMWSFGAKSPAEVMTMLNQYTLSGVVDKIKAYTLVIDSEADLFYLGQPLEVYNALKSPKTYMKFSAKEAAQAHCQMGAIAISNEKILNWLNQTLAFNVKTS